MTTVFGNSLILADDTTGKVSQFDITDRIPAGYNVYNIKLGTEGYIPCARKREDKTVDTSSLKAVPLSKEDVHLLKRAANFGLTNLDKCDKLLAHTEIIQFEIELTELRLARAAKTIFERISE